MDVFKFHIRSLSGKLHIGKVPKALDANGDEAAAISMSTTAAREPHNINGVALDVLLQIVDGVNGTPLMAVVENVRHQHQRGVPPRSRLLIPRKYSQCPAKICLTPLMMRMMVIVHA